MDCYGIISDTHHHAWSAFSREEGGVNSRLLQILEETRRMAMETFGRGGAALFHAGDMFHVRGHIAPSVLNPTLETYKRIKKTIPLIAAIPGNHDLEGNDSHQVSNAVTALETIGVSVAHKPKVHTLTPDWAVALFPWFYRIEDLIAQMEVIRDEYPGYHLDAIIHAPIDGVLPHLPPHGLEASRLGDLGYARVFAGHYHHHADLGNGVFSVGALTHQTWGDVGSVCGGLIVYRDRVEHIPSLAPRFVEITGTEDGETLERVIPGNYVRVKVEVSADSEVAELRESLEEFKPAGIVIHPVKKVVVTRAGAAPSGTPTIEASINAFCDSKELSAAVRERCMKILGEVRAIDD